MKTEVESIKQSAIEKLEKIQTLKDLEQLKIDFLGKKGFIASLMQNLKSLSKEEKPKAGQLINALKQELTRNIEGKEEELFGSEEQARLMNERIDVTMPGRRLSQGTKHPVTALMDQVLEILIELGFSVKYGPDIDSDYYNFEALNFSNDHPARDMQDTFYLSSEMLLRTHTSNVQVRVMETQKPPIRFVAPGRVYRNEAISARSHAFFHQVEGMYIDKDVTFAQLLATLKLFLDKLFWQGIPTRFRASYFPFVEPGLEVDVKCLVCKDGCSICKGTGWLEVLGAGMVHPEVLKSGGIDPNEYSGYAWGMGIERLLMIKNSIPDIRILSQNDKRFLLQRLG